MGQKVHPIGMRLGINKASDSKWFAERKHFADILQSDIETRKDIVKLLPDGSAISRIIIERTGNTGNIGKKNIKINLRTAKPGVVIGKGGEDIDKLKSFLSKKLNANIQINVEEIRKPELEAKLVAENVAAQLEKRVLFRRAVKRAVASSLKQGAKGIKIAVSGRLNGAEIARTEWYREGRVPLHTFRADISYSEAIAKTTYGVIGVKVWIFKGEILRAVNNKEDFINLESSAAAL
jgi:small subunit ribosomal protein S3